MWTLEIIKEASCEKPNCYDTWGGKKGDDDDGDGDDDFSLLWRVGAITQKSLGSGNLRGWHVKMTCSKLSWLAEATFFRFPRLMQPKMQIY